MENRCAHIWLINPQPHLPSSPKPRSWEVGGGLGPGPGTAREEGHSGAHAGRAAWGAREAQGGSSARGPRPNKDGKGLRKGSRGPRPQTTLGRTEAISSPGAAHTPPPEHRASSSPRRLHGQPKTTGAAHFPSDAPTGLSSSGLPALGLPGGPAICYHHTLYGHRGDQ